MRGFCRLLVLFVLVVTMPACGMVSPRVHTDDTLEVSPAVLDFGMARHVDSPIELSFQILNNSMQPLIVSKMLSNCGCTLIDVPKDPIPPNTSVVCKVKIDIVGRRGDFNSQIMIETEDRHHMLVDIRGKIINDIWFDKQAIRITAKREETEVSTTFTLFTVDYPNIVLRLDDPDDVFSISELSRIKQNEITAITFNLKGKINNVDFFQNH